MIEKQDTSHLIYSAKLATFMPWRVCFCAALFYLYEFIQLNMFNAIDHNLVETFHLTASQLGNLGSASLLANVIFLFPAGLLLDRFSTRQLILITLALCILGTLGFSQATDFNVAWVCRFATGIGSAFCLVSCMRLASRWFPSSHLALVIGLIITMGMLGGVLAQTPLTLLVEHAGWRNALVFDAALGTVFMVMILLGVRDYPGAELMQDMQQQLRQISVSKGLWLVIRRIQNWCSGIYACSMNLPLIVLGAIWGAPYLQTVRHLTLTEATLVTSMIFIGTIIGAPAMGWFSDLIQQRRRPMLVSSILSLVIMLIIIYAPNLDFHRLILLFLSLGFVTSAQVISFTVVTESNPAVLTASAVSIISFSTQGFGAFSQHFFGTLLDYYRQGTSGVLQYTVPVYQHTVVIFPIGFVVAFIVGLIIQETYGKTSDLTSLNSSEN